MKRMKSSEVRDNWRSVLAGVENGETIIIESYNRPVARLTPFRQPLRGIATTHNGKSTASISIQGVPMVEAAAYPDMVPSADGHLSETGEWVLHDRSDERPLRVTAPSLEEAIITWSQKLGHHLAEIVVDPVYPVHPDADTDDW